MLAQSQTVDTSVPLSGVGDALSNPFGASCSARERLENADPVHLLSAEKPQGEYLGRLHARRSRDEKTTSGGYSSAHGGYIQDAGYELRRIPLPETVWKVFAEA